MASELRLEPVPDRPWLSIVGIGEDGLAGLGGDARRHIAEAEFVFGGKRHLGLAADLIKGEARQWPSPFDAGDARSDVAAAAAASACWPRAIRSCTASARRSRGWFRPTKSTAFPAPSAFSLAAARLGWPLAEIETVSLHGKPVELLRPLLHPGRRVIALTSDENGPAAVAALLAASGFGGSTITVLEALGGARERIRATRADRFALDADRSAQRRGDRGRGSARRAHPAAGARPQPTSCSSMTARSPSARSAR